MTTTQFENPLLSDVGVRSAHDAIHNIFVLLRNHAIDAVKQQQNYAPEFIYELSDWVEVLPEYMQRQDAAAVEDFRAALQAISELHPCLETVRRRFDHHM